MELLAPAGNMECLKTAVQSGADAVYFAGKQFGARSFADNFSDEEIQEAAAYCRLHGVKSYLTVNTMTTDRELKQLDEFLKVLADAGIDGVIVQDLGVVRRIRQVCPDMPIHASTQMTVHNLDGVKELEEMGISRVVLARELSKEDMATILENCQAEIEVFVHGAMCMSYSGQCLMSSVLGGRSGNRGKCAQPCRLAYRSETGPEAFYLSLKDMSLIDHIKELKDMGVASLKIEGRMKGPDYIQAVVGTYRRCIDEMRKPTQKERERMNRVFFRGGLTDGYFVNQKGPTMFAFDKPDNPYQKKTEETLDNRIEERKIPVSCKGVFSVGKPPEISLTAEEYSVTVTGDSPLEEAQKGQAEKENIQRQLAKTGSTGFLMESIEIMLEGNPFLPMSLLNQLRRDGIAELEKIILQKAKKEYHFSPLNFHVVKEEKNMGFTASVQSVEQFHVVKKYPFVKIDLPLHLVAENPEVFLSEKDRILLNPAAILPDSRMDAAKESLDSLYQMGFCGLRAENIGLFPQGKRYALWGGHRLNLSNHLALQTIKESGLKVACLSAELNLAQIRDLQGELPTEVFGYGHLPLMITENCVQKNIGQCTCDGMGKIYDRKGMAFPIIKDDGVCRSVILNSVPLYMGDKLQDLKDTGIDFCRLFFTIEDEETCKNVCDAYFDKGDYKREYTRLHFYKGVK